MLLMMMEGGTWRSVEETSGEGTVKSRAAEKRAAQTEGVRTMCKLHNTALELRCGRAISAVVFAPPLFFFPTPIIDLRTGLTLRIRPYI